MHPPLGAMLQVTSVDADPWVWQMHVTMFYINWLTGAAHARVWELDILDTYWSADPNGRSISKELLSPPPVNSMLAVVERDTFMTASHKLVVELPVVDWWTNEITFKRYICEPLCSYWQE